MHTFHFGRAKFGRRLIGGEAARSRVNPIVVLSLVDGFYHRYETIHAELIFTLQRHETSMTQIVQCFQTTGKNVRALDAVLNAFGAYYQLNIRLHETNNPK